MWIGYSGSGTKSNSAFLWTFLWTSGFVLRKTLLEHVTENQHLKNWVLLNYIYTYWPFDAQWLLNLPPCLKTASSSSASTACAYVFCTILRKQRFFFLSNVNRVFLTILVNLQGYLKVGTEFLCTIQKKFMFKLCLSRWRGCPKSVRN